MGGEGQHTTAIPDNAAASFMLLWYDAVEAGDMQLINAMIASAGKGTLSFASGLPAGTTLTLIDYAPLLLGGYPTYYYYVVGEDEAGICQLALDQFVPVGEALDGENHFVGFSPVMMFNISYANADTTPTTERITLMTEGGVADMTLGLDKAEERVTEISPITAQLGAPMSGYIPLQDLDGRGYAEDDVVLATMYLKDENGTLVPLPATMDMGGDAVILNGMLGLPLATVGQIITLFDYLGTDTYLYPVSIDLDALRYHDFTTKNAKIYIEIVVVPAYVLEFDNALSFLGTDTHVDACYVADLHLQAAPQITFNEKKGSASAGDVLTLSTQLGVLNDPVTIELYVYQRVGTQMVHTDACDRLLAGYGNVADGISLTSGEMTLQVADSGVDTGVYFLVACYGGNYAVYTLTVTP